MYWFKIFSELIGGLALFLFAMLQMEEALKNLGGRSFKLFLKKHTENKFKAILSGTVVTTILQSSSLVNLMILAFVGAGVMTFRNAFSVSIGSNLGTTLSNWILAYVGFNFKIIELALPVLAIAILLFIFFSSNQKIKQVSKLLFGFGVLFLGLDFMKQSFSLLFQSFDFTPYLNYPRVLFTLFGFVITAIIQSSSATMVILLSALYGGVLTLPLVAAMIVGAELGSSMKVFLAAIGGNAEKKRLAMSNFLFNLVILFPAYFLIDEILYFVDYIGIKSQYIALVAFQTFFNLAGIILTFPFLNAFCLWMEKRYRDLKSFSTYYLNKIPFAVPDVGVDLLEKEAELFVHRVILMNLRAFNLDHSEWKHNSIVKVFLENDELFSSYTERYMDVKKAEGEMIECFYSLNESKIDHEDSIRLNRIMASARNAMYAAKSIRDVYEDRQELRNALNSEEYSQYKEIQKELSDFYYTLFNVLKSNDRQKLNDELISMLKEIHLRHTNRMKDLYKEGIQHGIEEVDLSTLLNVNREIFSSCKAMVFAVKDLFLSEQDAQSFDNIPLKEMN
jgi:phosphate:Na+ symporter